MRRLLVLVVVALTLVVVPAMALSPGDTVLVNRAADGTQGGGAHPNFAVSSDGRCVAFASTGPTLPGANGNQQIYVRDTVANTTTLASATPGGAGGNDQSTFPDITPDCRYVAFDSEATNLTADVVDKRLVYRRDLQTGTTVLVSRATGLDGAIPDQVAFTPTISDDGQRIVFPTFANNLAADDRDGGAHTDLFLREVVDGTTTHVSRNGDDEPQNGTSGAGFYPTLSGDGTLLAFDTNAANMSTEDTPPGGSSSFDGRDVFVKNLTTGDVTYVSRAGGASGAAGNSSSSLSEISGDGKRVAFASSATNLGVPSGGIFVRDLATNQTMLASRDAAGNSADAGTGDQIDISTDGDRVVFYSAANNLPGGGGDADQFDVFVNDLSTGVTEVASRRSDGTAAGSAFFAAISGDGNHVAFTTSEGLVADDTDGESDLYLHHFVPGAGGTGPTPTPTATAQPPLATPMPPGPPPAAQQTIRGAQAFVQGTANDLYLACTTLDLYLVDVLPAGRKVAVTGAADLRLAGRTADILLDGRKVGTARIGAGGAFAAKVAAPARTRRARARYQAKVGSTASQKLRLVRRMVATTLTRSGGNLRCAAS